MQPFEIESLLVTEILRGGPVTRNELLAAFPMRPATLFSLLHRLMTRGILDEPERKGKKTGRKASPVGIRAGLGCFAGVEIDVDHVCAVFLDAAGGEKGAVVRRSVLGKEALQARADVLAALNDLRIQVGEEIWSGLRGLGFADPGLVDPGRGVSLRAINVPGWENFDVRTWLSEAFGVEICVVPGAYAEAHAEYRRSDGRRDASLLFVQMGVGVGAGFVKDGDLFAGDSGCAMELGHTIIREQGPLCPCGNRGCLEALTGLPAIQRRVEELERGGVWTALRSSAFTAERFLEIVARGDKTACALALEIGEHVGTALATAVTLLNPGRIVFGGWIENLGESFCETVRRRLAVRCLPSSLNGLELRIAIPDELRAARGAALMARDRTVLSAIHGV